jgi:hypothetical protein
MLARIWVFAALAMGCGKAEYQTCDKVCRHYFTLNYVGAGEGHGGDAGADDFQTRLERGVDFCISKCQKANNDSQNECILAATTAAAAEACEEK